MTKDVTKAIQPKSDQLNSDNLITGPMTIKIRDVQVKNEPEQPIWIYFDGDDNKPWKPCKTAARCLASIWGANAAQWVGMSCTLYNDPTVTWGGAAVGGIRVSHMQGLDKPRTLQLTKTRGKKSAVVIKPLTMDDAPDTPTIDADAIQSDAMKAAKCGRDAFNKWWTDNPALRDVVKPIMDELKSAVERFETDNDDETPL